MKSFLNWSQLNLPNRKESRINNVCAEKTKGHWENERRHYRFPLLACNSFANKTSVQKETSAMILLALLLWFLGQRNKVWFYRNNNNKLISDWPRGRRDKTETLVQKTSISRKKFKAHLVYLGRFISMI